MSMEALQERIGYRFHDKALLERALIHSSYANESRQKIECNERMEFLGPDQNSRKSGVRKEPV